MCADCNNGWMSNLENEVQSVLLELISGKKEPSSLSDEERLIVSRWAAKTCYMLNSSSNYTVKVPAEHLRALWMQERKLPWGVMVCASRAPRESCHWLQTTRWVVSRPERARAAVNRVIDAQTYKIGLHFGELCLVTCWNSIPRWTISLDERYHELLWPRDKKCGWHEINAAVLDETPAEHFLIPLVHAISLDYIPHLKRVKPGRVPL